MTSSSTKLKRVRPLLGTFVEIELRGDTPRDTLNNYITAAFDEIAQIDRLMSYHRPDSDLTKLNASSAGVWVQLDRRTIEVLEYSNVLYRRSQGIFDIRCGGPLVEKGILPGPHRMLKKRVRTDTSLYPVKIHGSLVRKKGPWVFDLGGIAKGYAVDGAVQTIQNMSRGRCLAGIVNAGGDLRVWGENSVQVAALVHGQTPSTRRFPIKQTAAAVSSVRSPADQTHRFAPSAQVRMPSGEFLQEERTVMVFAGRCLWADALTKVALLGPSDVAAQTLACYQARALVFQPDGHLERTIN